MGNNIALNLLHIEDSNEDAYIVNQSLKKTKSDLYSYDITLAPDLKSALIQLEKQKNYNAILLDLNLPDGKGIENIKTIRSINPDIPIVVLTGNMDEETALNALSEGAQEYIVKTHSNGPVIQRIIQSSIFRKRAEIELSRKAYTDGLTGLPNRGFFEHAAKGMMQRAQRAQVKNALMFIDLNKFKEINDTYGHEAGNIVLQEVATRLKNTLRTSDLIARYAGDEFVIYMDSGKESVTEELCRFVAEKIVKTIETPINIETREIEISLSIGIALFPNDGQEFDALLKSADQEMYRAKKSPDQKYSIIGRKPEKKKSLDIKKLIQTPVNKNDAKNTILIIDDDIVDRAIYKKTLKRTKNQFDVQEVNTLKEAFKFLETNTPDCILLDYTLPDGTGIDFLATFKVTSRVLNSAVVMLTGKDDRHTATEAIKHGAKDYIVKNQLDHKRFTNIISNAIEKQSLEKELKQHQQELERSNTELSDFSHTVAHDLKAPARKIFSFCEILKNRTEHINDENVHSCIDRMSVSADRMQKLINDLLEYAQIDHNRESKKFVPLNSIAHDVVTDLESWLEEKQAHVTVNKLPKWPVYPVKIQQVLNNLIINAVKYSAPDRLPEITITSQVKEGICTINVEDNGLGIDSHQVPKIFYPFHRLHSADEIEGSGLGLSICQKILQKHGGHISVTSKVMEGSRFELSLPR